MLLIKVISSFSIKLIHDVPIQYIILKTFKNDKSLEVEKLRPITPQLIFEVLRLVRYSLCLSPEIAQKALLLSRNRSREVLNQMESMGLITIIEKGYQLSDRGIRLLSANIDENLQRVHRIFLEYPPYAIIFEGLERKSATVSEIAQRTGMSSVAADIILRLIGWTHPELTRNPQTGRYYLASKESLSEQEFFKVLHESYKKLSAPSSFRMRKLYVRIFVLRRFVCERLGIAKDVFDDLLRQTLLKQSDHIELASAPAIGVSEKPFILTPKGKPYYYIRIEKVFRYEKA